MSRPLVSVIIPVYNRAQFIGDAIESILNQTYQDFELIIVNDGSTDETLKKIEVHNDDRISLYSFKENRGTSAAFNFGVKKSRGEFIARLDSDDIALERRLEKQVDILLKMNVDLCGGWLCYGNKGKVLKYSTCHEQLKADLLMNCPFSIASIMVDSKVLKSYPFDETLRFGEDYDFFRRVLFRYKAYVIPEVLVKYRWHLGQLSVENKEKQLLQDVDIKLKLFKHFKYDSNAFGDEILKRLIKAECIYNVKDFNLLINWLKTIRYLNHANQIYDYQELNRVLYRYKNHLISCISNGKSNEISHIRKMCILLKHDPALLIKKAFSKIANV